MKRLIPVLSLLLAASALAVGCAAEDTASSDSSSSSSSESSNTSTTKAKKKKATCNASKRCDQRVVVRRVKNGQVRLGMTKSQVRAKIGRPSDANNSSMDLGDETYETSLWTYSPKLEDFGDVDSVILTFEGDVLKSKSTG